MLQVTLVPLGAVENPLLEYLALMIGETLRCEVSVESRQLSADPAYDPLRRQHHSTRLLESLEKGWGEDAGKVLGVALQDLFIPILTFVFGEAQLGGRAAIISIARLRQGFYGLPDDPALLYHRAEKEALHELGHTLGLVHCPDYGCVMRFSNSVEEVDLKGERFCTSCAARVEEAYAQGGTK